MKKLIQTLLFGTAISIIGGCNGSNSTSSNSNNWDLVGGSIPGNNIMLNSIAYGNGKVYTGGSVDVNNPAVFNNSANSWQITAGNYLPNPYGATEQVNSIAINNNTLFVAVNTTVSGSFGSRPTVGYLVNNAGTGGSWQILANESGVPDNGGINSIAVNNGTTYAGTGGYNLDNNTYYGHVYSCAGAQSPWLTVGGESIPNGGVVYSVALIRAQSTQVLAAIIYRAITALVVFM